MTYTKCPYCGNTSDVGVCPWCGPVDCWETHYITWDSDGNEIEITEEEANELPEEEVLACQRLRKQYWPWERLC